MPITPDTKDWTWVLERTCPECHFDVNSFPRESTGALLRNNAVRWRELLGHPDVRERPSDEVWSGLEYGCHVRDVFGLYDERLVLMLEEDNPLYPNWNQDETALAEHYGDQDPKQVSEELSSAADRLADRFDSLNETDWARTGRRSDGALFNIETFARYLAHDPIHHVHDVERGYERLEQAR